MTSPFKVTRKISAFFSVFSLPLRLQFGEIGERKGEGATFNNIGSVYLYLGQYPKALEFFQQALAINKQVGDKSGEGATLNNIGSVYHKTQIPVSFLSPKPSYFSFPSQLCKISLANT
ncbi:MAG: tetratricopeptide repeat protein [Nostoc sp.]|uniref:tetratricopeptide repeat protein n=1 Tax=Nostoc sp. TaxID=1180 RepID=UPI002FF814EE